MRCVTFARKLFVGFVFSTDFAIVPLWTALAAALLFGHGRHPFSTAAMITHFSLQWKLYITVTARTVGELADTYGFNADQRHQLAELRFDRCREMSEA